MIEIKITGASIPELADKLTAIGRALYAQSSYEADNAAREALQAKRDVVRGSTAAAAAAEQIAEKAEEIATEKRTRRKKAEEPAPEPAAEGPEATEREDAPALSYQRDVSPAVLRAVERGGRDKVVAILKTFGAGKASEVPAERWAELIEAVNAA
jgi:hypothetical protein